MVAVAALELIVAVVAVVVVAVVVERVCELMGGF